MNLLQVDIQNGGYEKKNPSIHDINFELLKGELVGLIGSNGAGKSTTIKAILGLLPYMQGKVVIKGGMKYGYIPERPIFYDDLTLWEHLDFIAAMENLDEFEYQTYAESLLKAFSLEDQMHHYPHTFSKGMQQKAMLIMALLTKPDIYIIDEPFMGLDPIATKRWIDFMNEEKERGAGILMTTHVLDTAEKICDRFILVHKGTLFAGGTLRDLQDQCKLEKATLFDCFHEIAGENIHE